MLKIAAMKPDKTIFDELGNDRAAEAAADSRAEADRAPGG